MSLRFEAVAKDFGAGAVIRDVAFRLETGTFGVIVGPSGCGKSTLLSLAAGLETASAGYVFADGREVSGISTDVAMIFQDHNLFAWANARDNVAFGLEMRGMRRGAARARAVELLEEVGLARYADRVPAELSGGMKQRVALARVLALKPRIVLLDEPFAALDYQTRRLMQTYLRATVRRTGGTTLLVTHDLPEALTLADRLILFSGSPGTVREVIDIAADHPRDLAHPVLAALQRDLEAHLEAEALHGEFTAEERVRLLEE
ncbi:ABC transporter ATP-binding protein [uncultured Methylobacterium sp.]|uniref:ABC transporter ATP-binding protein n=1 Tax=uncultured Methylobacterium sp. TaxID=157278 RepID=UPI0035CBAA6F